MLKHICPAWYQVYNVHCTVYRNRFEIEIEIDWIPKIPISSWKNFRDSKQVLNILEAFKRSPGVTRARVRVFNSFNASIQQKIQQICEFSSKGSKRSNNSDFLSSKFRQQVKPLVKNPTKRRTFSKKRGRGARLPFRNIISSGNLFFPLIKCRMGDFLDLIFFHFNPQKLS